MRTHPYGRRLAAAVLTLGTFSGFSGATIIAASPAHAAGAGLACNGSFESPVVAAPFKNFTAGHTIGCWTVGAGNVDLLHSNAAADGAQYVDLDGTNADGEVHQSIATTAHTIYTISFKLSGNPAGAPTVKTVVVTFAATTRTFQFSTVGVTATNLKWQTVAFDAPATATATTLSIKSTDPSNGHNSYGAFIDAVSVKADHACNGSFETPVVAPPFKNFTAGHTIGCWTVGAGNVDLLHSNAAADGAQYVDLDGTNADGEVHQSIATTTHTLYTISFKLSGNPAGAPTVKTVVVTFAATTKTYQFSTVGVTANVLKWQTVAFDAPATTTRTTLSIKSTDPANGHNSYGAFIDAVSIAA